MNQYGRVPLDLPQTKAPRGEVFLILARCKGCDICITFCPQEVLRASASTNAKGYHPPEVAPGKEAACVHCEFCSMVCPEFAIFTREVVV